MCTCTFQSSMKQIHPNLYRKTAHLFIYLGAFICTCVHNTRCYMNVRTTCTSTNIYHHPFSVSPPVPPPPSPPSSPLPPPLVPFPPSLDEDSRRISSRGLVPAASSRLLFSPYSRRPSCEQSLLFRPVSLSHKIQIIVVVKQTRTRVWRQKIINFDNPNVAVEQW